MHLKSLKVKIAITIALLLLIAVGLTNFVLLRTMERSIVSGHFTSIGNWLETFYESVNSPDASGAGVSVEEKMALSNIAYISYALGNQRIVYARNDPGRMAEYTRELVETAKRTGRPQYRRAGSEWGVFWTRSKYLVIAHPMEGGAGAAVIALGPDYEKLRNAQRIASGYLVLNFLILFFLGIYRLTGLVTRPIHRLIRLTENYRATDSFDFFPETQNDEFSRLSSSLNRMMRRIEDDRRELEKSIQAVEEANRDLQRAQQEIIRAEKLASMGRLSAGIAHEIGNPVGIVLGYLGLLRSRCISPEDSNGMDYIERAEAEISRINKTIRQLLDFSRSNPAGFFKISIHDLVYDTVRMLQQQPLMEKIRFFFDFRASDDVMFGDYSQMYQVMVNLILNAADALGEDDNPDSREIRLVTDNTDDGKCLRIEVQDNGPGIAPENRDKVFDPFFTTKETGRGTGLGLYVCYMIIEHAGGTISAENGPDAGTCIVIHLPLYGKGGTCYAS